MDCADYCIGSNGYFDCPWRYELHGRNVVKGKKEILVGVSSNEDFLVFQRLLDELENIDKARHGEDGTEMIINASDENLTAIALGTLQNT